MCDFALEKIEARDGGGKAPCQDPTYEEAAQRCCLANGSIRRNNFVVVSEDKLSLKIVTTKRNYGFVKADGTQFTDDEVLKVIEKLYPTGKIDYQSVYRTINAVFPSKDTLLLSAFEGADELFQVAFDGRHLSPYRRASNFLLKKVRLECDLNFYGDRLCLEELSFLGNREITVAGAKEVVLLDCKLPELNPPPHLRSSVKIKGKAEKLVIIGDPVYGKTESVIDLSELELCDNFGKPTQIVFISGWQRGRRSLTEKEIIGEFRGSAFREDNIQAVIDYIQRDEGRERNSQLRKIEKSFDHEQRRMERAFKVMAYAEKAIWALKELDGKEGIIARGVYNVTKHFAPILLHIKGHASENLERASTKLVVLEHQRMLVKGEGDVECLGISYDGEDLKFVYGDTGDEEGRVSYEFNPEECVKELIGDGATDRLNEYAVDYLDNMKDMLSSLINYNGSSKTEGGELIDLINDENLPLEIKSLLGMKKKSSRRVAVKNI